MANEDFNNNQGSGMGGASGSGSSGFGNSGDLDGSAGYGTSGTGGFGSTAAAGAAGAAGTTGTGAAGAGNLKDRAANLSSTARERAGEFAGTAREKAGELKSSLADKLEQGADKLRSRGGSASFAGAAGDGSVAMDNRADQITTRLAGGMQGTAEWLREADLENMRVGIERQVRENPGRSLLVAVGLGYLLGKAFRR